MIASPLHDRIFTEVPRPCPQLPKAISHNKAELPKCFTDWLTKHPVGLGNGKGGDGLAYFDWFPDKHYRLCKKKKTNCRCCTAKKDKKAENDSCEFCMAAWRLSQVSCSWMQVLLDFGHHKTRHRKEWSNEYRAQKRRERLHDYGNTYSPSINYYIGGVQPPDETKILAIAQNRLVQPGSEPQGKAREWPNMMDITPFQKNGIGTNFCNATAIDGKMMAATA